jgi:hypothetical protein
MDTELRAFNDSLAEVVELGDVWDVGEEWYECLNPKTWLPCGISGPVEDLRQTEVAAVMTANGIALRSSRSQVAPLPEADPLEIRRARRAGSRAWDRRTQGGVDGLDEWRRWMLEIWRSTHRRLADTLGAGQIPDPLDSATLGRIAAGLCDGTSRQAILASIAGREREADQLIEAGAQTWLAGPQAFVIDPRQGARVGGSEGQAAEMILTGAAVLAPAKRKGQLFACLAWLAWAMGDSVCAAIACERAKQCPGDIALADIIDNFLTLGVSPHCPERSERVIGSAPLRPS